MAGVRRGLEILHGLYFIALFILCIIPAWAGLLFFRDHRAAGRYTSAALKFLFFLSGTRVRVVGKEFMDTPGAKIYASNHTSYFDVLPLMMGLGVPYRFIAKEEVHKMPFIGTFLRKMGHLSFVRTDANARRDAAQQIEACVRHGDSVFVFPEGTFVSEEGVRPFQLGAFNAAVATGAQVVPVSLAGTRRFLRDGTYLPRPTSVTITLSAPVRPKTPEPDSSDWHEVVRLRDATREQIARHSGEPLL
jgi:1-acyl-sn-glycerol-3-phosphate acyltransferase